MNRVTARDEKLLHRLGEFGVLSTSQLRFLFFADVRKTTMLRRLRALESMQLLRRLRGLPDGSHGWCLTKKCASAIGVVPVGNGLNRHTLGHDVTLSQVRLALAGVGIGTEWTPEHVLRFEAWQSRKPHSTRPENIPDAVFTVETSRGGFAAVALELELTAKSTSLYKKTLKAYRYNQTLGMVWFLVPNIALGKKLERVWKKVGHGTLDRTLQWSLIREVLETPYDSILHDESAHGPLRERIIMKPPPAHGGAQTMSS